MTEGPVATVFAVDDDESFLTAIGRVLQLGGYDGREGADRRAFLQRQPSPAPGMPAGGPADAGHDRAGVPRAASRRRVDAAGRVPQRTGHDSRHDAGPEGRRARFPDQAGQVRRPAERRSARRSSVTAPSSPPPHDLAVLRGKYDSLTPREREVCVGVARGQLNKQIAYDLNLTLATIKFHRARGLIKLGVNSVPGTRPPARQARRARDADRTGVAALTPLRPARAAPSSSSDSAAALREAGNHTTNRAPPSAAFSARMRPPAASRIDRLIARPTPSPSGLVVKNGSNRRGSTSGGMPGP